MKTLNLLSSLVFFTGVAQAQMSTNEVKPDGAVLDNQCGVAREENIRMGGFTVVEVCTANIQGVEGEYLTVKESRAARKGATRQTTVWVIQNKDGNTWHVQQTGAVDEQGNYQPSLATVVIIGKVKVTKSKAGAIKQMQGELSGRKFIATDFSYVFHTEGVAR